MTIGTSGGNIASAPHEFHSLAALRACIGQEVGQSDWWLIDQQRIDQFADATGDRQWIHVDATRCRTESPFGTTIAHGYLTLSLLPAMMEQAVLLRGVRMAINYGADRIRFPAPVPCGSRLRARVHLRAVESSDTGARLVWDVTVERENSDKPACVAGLITLVDWPE